MRNVVSRPRGGGGGGGDTHRAGRVNRSQVDLKRVIRAGCEVVLIYWLSERTTRQFLKSKSREQRGARVIIRDDWRPPRAWESAYKIAVQLSKLAHDIIGLAYDHSKLGELYMWRNQFDLAEQSFMPPLGLNVQIHNVQGATKERSLLRTLAARRTDPGIASIEGATIDAKIE
ncbi:hypothetical protein Hypma_009933 [Hypsizygus marmoreus]|uniref:Uncharacterized protein n=1 Tax=Hypsizygus marmoreus TaxID=39966 RepID=A0A369JWM7_HYPMA|nr:hypothetical protein Hypma_009933 [Hypsizygus marmoreus]